jgi:cytochrome c biogenesis protein CcmG, thiol:disulfide interchange protein DsbE
VKRPHTAAIVAAAVAVVLGALVIVVATRSSALDRVSESPLLGKPAPVLTGESVTTGDAGVAGDAPSFDLAAEDGRFVLVNFFATWCVPCQAEHDDLLRFSEAHAASGDARVVSVVFRGDEPDDVRQFFAERGGDWPVVGDPAGTIATAWGAVKVPESYLVDPTGRVVSKIIGGVDYGKLEELVARVRQSS